MTNQKLTEEEIAVNTDKKRGTIIRVIHNRENPFVQLNKQALWDSNISLKAVGLWARCMSRPNNWRFNIKELVSKCREGRRAIDGAMNELIEAGYAIRMKYDLKGADGKYVKSVIEYIFFEFPATQEEKDEQLEIFKKSFPHCGFGHVGFSNLRNSELLIKSNKEKDFKEIESSLKVPEEPIVAVAPSIPKIKKSSKSNKKKTKEFSQRVLNFAETMIGIIIKHNKLYRKPADMTKFYESVEKMLEVDNQDEEEILNIFEWAVSDNEKRNDFPGWKGFITGDKRKNPAGYFYDRIMTIQANMNAKKERKFAPCSDADRMSAATKRMREGAL